MGLIESNSYPETSNLTLEEVDFLFVKEGSKGIHKFTGPSQPVKISLSEDVEQGAKEMMHDEKRGSEGGAAYVEDINKVEGQRYPRQMNLGTQVTGSAPAI